MTNMKRTISTLLSRVAVFNKPARGDIDGLSVALYPPEDGVAFAVISRKGVLPGLAEERNFQNDLQDLLGYDCPITAVEKYFMDERGACRFEWDQPDDPVDDEDDGGDQLTLDLA